MNQSKAKRSPRAAQPAAVATTQAQKRAAVILEVLGGIRSAQEAAAALAISANHYYILERQALAALVAACELQPRGKQPDPAKELEALRQELAQARQECQRQAALVRATQRAIGLPPVPAPAEKQKGTSGSKSGRRRRRLTSVRALRAARALQKSVAEEPPPVVEQMAGVSDRVESSLAEEGAHT